MRLASFLSVGLVAGLAVGCKMSGGSDSSTAASSAVSQGVSCQLSAAQAAQVAAAQEFQSTEKVSLDALDASERSAIEGQPASGSCSEGQVTSLAESFPSVATALSAEESRGAVVAGMGPVGDLSMPGVVRTEYIVVPKAGSRYLAGYNSDGIMVLLLRLMQHRPR